MMFNWGNAFFATCVVGAMLSIIASIVTFSLYKIKATLMLLALCLIFVFIGAGLA